MRSLKTTFVILMIFVAEAMCWNERRKQQLITDEISSASPSYTPIQSSINLSQPTIPPLSEIPSVSQTYTQTTSSNELISTFQPTILSPTFIIKSKRNGYCLSLPHSNYANGDNIILKECNVDSSQLWYFNGQGFLQSVSNMGKCLQVKGLSFRLTSPIEINECEYSNEAQKWEILQSGEIRSKFDDSYCFDENGVGGIVKLWYCDGSSDQFWSFIPEVNVSNAPTSSPTFTKTISPSSSKSMSPTIKPSSIPSPVMIRSMLDGYCFQIRGQNAVKGARIILSTCNGTEHQMWYTDNAGLIRSTIDYNKCIQIDGPINKVSQEIIIDDCDDSKETQRFHFLPSGEIKLRHDIHQYCIDGNGFGAVLYIWPCDQTPDQYWERLTLNEPSATPSALPTISVMPTKSLSPSVRPSEKHSNAPSLFPPMPSKEPSLSPTVSLIPTTAPSFMPSSTPTISPFEIMIKSKRNGYCLDTLTSNPSNHNQIILSICNESKPSQIWIIDNQGLIHSSINPNKCIQPKDLRFNHGSVFEIYDCNAKNAAQKWEFTKDGNIKSRIRWAWGRDDSCMDGNNLGEVVYVWGCDGSSDQYWNQVFLLMEGNV